MSEEAATRPAPTLSEFRLAFDGEDHLIPASGLSLGRDPDCDVLITSERASAPHARVPLEPPLPLITDLGSTNGTRVNGRRISEPTVLTRGDIITIGGSDLQVVEFVQPRPQTSATAVIDRLPAAPEEQTRAIDVGIPPLEIGREPGAGLVLDDPNVSRVHAQLQVRPDGAVELLDQRSANGTFVNGERIDRHLLQAGDDVRIGPYTLTFDGAQLAARNQRGSLHLRAEGVCRKAESRMILEPTSLSIGPGEYVAIIGESGAGKTTLLKCLAGVTQADEGEVLVNGEDLTVHQTSIGYVPQVDIVHGGLTLGEALRYAAQLRLPEDTDAAGIDEAVRTAAAELGLEEHLGTRVDKLSGGQRRRTGVAVELLSQPSLLFLDEPTTGLDPGFERKMMELLRGLADTARAVVIVTHATQSLQLCDRVIVMGRGGRMLFDGSPSEALGFFEVASFDEVYTALDTTPTAEWAERFAGIRRRFSRSHPRPPQSAPSPPPPRQSHRHQRRGLARRYLRILTRHPRHLLILLGQVPLIALALIGLFKPNVFAASGNPSEAAQLLFLLITTALWLGSIDAAREIIKERGVMTREAAIGVGRSAYVQSKVTVLFGLVGLQALLLVGLVFAFRPLHDSALAYVLVGAGVLLTGFAAGAMGLVISALVRSQDQATSLVPLVLIPQLFFAGAIIPVEKMSAVTKAVAALVFARWSFAEVGSAVDMNARFAASPTSAAADTYGTEFFSLSPAVGLAILVVFTVTFVLVTRALLRRGGE